MASMTGLTAEQLAQLLDGANPLPMPTYSLPAIYDGVLPVGLGVQGTKRDRGSLPNWDNSLSEPWGGAYDQTVYRNGQTRRDVIQNIPAPPVQTASGYSGLDTIDTLNPIDVNNWGLTRQSFFAKPQAPAEQAIVEATIRGGSMPPSGGSRRGRPTRPLPSSPLAPLGPPAIAGGDSWAGLRVAPSGEGRSGLVTGTPGGVAQAPQQRSGGLLGLILGLMGGGQQQGGNLGALLSGMGGHDTSSPEAFAASVTRPSNIPGVQQFTGTVQQGQAGQNRFGSTARNELLALYT